MFPKKPELTISIPSKTELLKMVVEVSKHIAIIHQFSFADAQKIALAVDEAITNVIKHSYESKTDGIIKLDFFTNSNGIKINVSFAGIPPVLKKVTVDLNKMIKAKKKSGLGVELMRRIMDSVEYRTSDDMNCCEMIKWKHKK